MILSRPSSYIIFSILILLTLNVSANMLISNNGPWKTGNIIADNDDLHLVEETVSFELFLDTYRAVVRYEITAKTAPYQGKIYFPFLCVSTYCFECVETAEFSLNGKKQAFEFPPADRIGVSLSREYKELAWEFLKRHRITTEADPESEYEKYNVIIGAGEVTTESKTFSLEVSYVAKYLNSHQGVTSSAFIRYSDDIIYYDFSPASLWSKNNIRQLEVTVDTRKAINSSLVNHSAWELVEQGKDRGLYRAVIRDTPMSEIEPMVIGVDNSSYKEYESIISSLKYSRQSAVFSSQDGMASQDDRYAADKLSDNNFKTAWCSNKKNPRFTYSIPAAQHRPNCWFQGFLKLNGYAKSEKIWYANSRVLQLETTVSGVNYVSGEPVHVTKSHTLQQNQNFRASYPFGLFEYIPVQIVNIEMPGKQRFQSIDLNQDKGVEIDFVVRDVVKGAKYNDTCISEIVPVFNCG